MPIPKQRHTSHETRDEQIGETEAFAVAIADQRLQLDYALARRAERLIRLQLAKDATCEKL